MNRSQNIDEVRKKIREAKLQQRFICHLCGAKMWLGSKYYHLRTFHQGSAGHTQYTNISYQNQVGILSVIPF